MSGTLILVRHAKTDLAGHFCGHSDPPLNEEGLAQLADLTARFAEFPLTKVFSSDLQRARQTAEPIAARSQLKVHILPSLREIAFGRWEGLTWEQVMALDSDYAQRWLDRYPTMPAPGGERYDDFRNRIQSAMSELAREVYEGCAAVITHAGVIRTFLGPMVRLPQPPVDFSKCDYASCWEVQHDAGNWSLLNGSISPSAIDLASPAK